MDNIINNARQPCDFTLLVIIFRLSIEDLRDKMHRLCDSLDFILRLRELIFRKRQSFLSLLNILVLLRKFVSEFSIGSLRLPTFLLLLVEIVFEVLYIILKLTNFFLELI